MPLASTATHTAYGVRRPSVVKPADEEDPPADRHAALTYDLGLGQISEAASRGLLGHVCDVCAGGSGGRNERP